MAKPVRLACGLNGLRSRYWTFNTTSGDPGLYIGREDLAGMAHLSLHADRDWHLTANGRDFRLPIARRILSTGVRHAVRVLIFPSACQLSEPMGKAEVLELDPSDEGVALAIDLFLLDQGGHVVGQAGGEWLPRWELAMPGGFAAQILPRAVRSQAFEISIDAPTEAITGIADGLEQQLLDHMLVLGPDDGPVTIVDAAVHPTR